MSSDPKHGFPTEDAGLHTTVVSYGKGCRPEPLGSVRSVSDLDTERPSQEPAAASAAAAKPRRTRWLEFRLSGSERQVQSLPLEPSPGPVALVAIRAVRAFLTRPGEPDADPGFVSGLEVEAELRDGRIVCSAQVSDFGSGELVVVQVDVAV